MASSICNSITSYENVHVGSCNQHLEIEIEIVSTHAFYKELDLQYSHTGPRANIRNSSIF